MRIAGSSPLPPAASTPIAKSSGRKETAAAEVDNTQPPASAAAPAESKPHGPVRAAEHSNRSDVAAVRQWINHPERRDQLAIPDLAAEHKGKGFEKAVAAYQAVAPAPSSPDPVATDPDPVVTEPIITDPVVTNPVVTDPVVTEPIITELLAGEPES